MTELEDPRVIDVLLVEDDEGDVLMTREAFEYYKIQNRLHVVGDGEQALQFLRRTGPYADAPRPGLILLDVNLPDEHTCGPIYYAAAGGHTDLVKLLRDKSVKIAVEPEDSNPWYAYVLQWVPMLLFIGVWIFFMRQMQGGARGAMGFGKSKARLLTENKNRVSLVKHETLGT